MENGFEKELVDALKEVVKNSGWQCLGTLTDLQKNTCTVHAKGGRGEVRF
jgi:hypothetical protein